VRNGPTYRCSDRTGLRFVEESVALWSYRHLVRELIARDIKARYKRSALGVGWTMLSPLLNMAALTFAFSTLLRQQIANFPVYLLCGSSLGTSSRG
jgi:ABC-type polysaccharide/polyol phosphate export permease